MSDVGDLQTRIAAYMSKQRTRRVSVSEIAREISAGRNLTSMVLTRIVNGEARPYPIVRVGSALEGLYTWVHDPADHTANMTVLAEMIGYMTGADHDQAANLAATVIRLHREGLG